MSKGLSRKALIAILVVCLAGAIAGVAYLVNAAFDIQQVQERQEQTPVPNNPTDESTGSSSAETSSAAEPELPDNPIDFATLRKKNSDIYAWITVPDTKVNYPVLQNPMDNSFYLNHNEDKEEAPSGYRM